MKIIDCFIFYNELKMLLFRLSELNEYVDYFIIVESTFTFTGNKKDLFFKNNASMFESFKEKIIHIIVDDMPNNGIMRIRETNLETKFCESQIWHTSG